MAREVVPPFDQAERYGVARAAATLLGRRSAPLHVLDVGGYFELEPGTVQLPIARVLPDCWTVAIDRAAGPVAERGPDGACAESATRYVRADATALPFASRRFDLVTCLDVLEHLPDNQRSELIGELLRASRALVIVCAPDGADAVRAAEQALQAFVRQVMGGDQEQLAEHARYGLPDTERIAAAFEHSDWRLTTFAYGDLARWLAMMAMKYALLAMPDTGETHADLDRRFVETLGHRDASSVCYRRFYIAQHVAVVDDVAGAVRERFSRDPIATPIDALGDVLELAAPLVADEARRAHERLHRHAHEAAVLREEMTRLRRRAGELEALFRDVERSMVYKLYKLVGRK